MEVLASFSDHLISRKCQQRIEECADIGKVYGFVSFEHIINLESLYICGLKPTTFKQST